MLNLVNETAVAVLTDQQKLEIVLSLARFATLAEIAKDFKERHDIELPAMQIGIYDPTRTYFAAGEKWKKLFDDERARYLADVQAIPVANQGYRLNVLQRGINAAIARGNWVLVATLAEQAAKEVGGALTNQRNVTVSRPVDELTADERRAQFAELVRKAMEMKDPPGTAEAPPAVQ